jgi:hypothetical protein
LNLSGCSFSDSLEIEVVWDPTITITPPGTFCYEAMIDRQSIGLQTDGLISQFIWTFENGSIPDYEGLEFPPVKFTNSGMISLRAIGPCGDTTISIPIDVYTSSAPDETSIEEIFYEDLRSDCNPPFRYFYIDKLILEDSIFYSNDLTEIERTSQGTILRVSTFGEPDGWLSAGMKDDICFFRDSVFIKEGNIPYSPNIQIDLYELRLSGDPSKYLARIKGLSKTDLIRWGYMSKDDFTSKMLGSFDTLPYVFLESIADTSTNILFAEVSTSGDSSCYVRYFKSSESSIFSQRNGRSEIELENLYAVILFPNPGGNNVQVKYNGPTGARIQVEVYSVYGELLKSFNFLNAHPTHPFVLETNQLPSGMYHLIVYDLDNHVRFTIKYAKQ